MTNPNSLPVDGVSLLPCPFCGARAVLTGSGPYRANCTACNAALGPIYCVNPNQAIAAWNRRIPPAAGGVSEARVEAAAKALHDRQETAGDRVPYGDKWQNCAESYRDSLREDARAALAASDALAPAAGQPVAIKGLEWSGSTARSPFGEYRVYSDPFGWVFDKSGDDPFSGRPVFPTESSARTAAQADYETRAALAPIPERVNAVVEADWFFLADDPDISGDLFEVTVDMPEGRPLEIKGAAVVSTRWIARLPAAEDADSDDEWECEAAGEAECLRLIAAEKDRRASLTSAKE